MPIIANVGRRRLNVRCAIAGMYLVLIAGGCTMLYPFLLMLATSLTGPTDYRVFRLLPRYLFEDEARYVKFLAEKYQLAREYAGLHAGECHNLARVRMPTVLGAGSTYARPSPRADAGDARAPRPCVDTDWPHLDERVRLWRAFKQTLRPETFALWHVGRRALPGRAETLWRDDLRRVYDGDIRALNRDLGKRLHAFTEVFAPYENPEGRLWPGLRGREGALWRAFKGALAPEYRRPVDGTVVWQSYLRFKYEEVSRANHSLGTDHAAFDHFQLLSTLPEDPTLAAEWEHFVRNELPYRFIEFPGGDARYRRYLVEHYGPVADIDQRLGTSYRRLANIHWPPIQPAPRELDAVSAFLRTTDAIREAHIATPDKQYMRFLSARFGQDLGRLNATLATGYVSLEHIRPPYLEEDMWEFRAGRRSWMTWFLTRNYAEAIDYIAIRGRALWNTLILVGSMVLCALTINPLAAYALSRFRLSCANQVLLFLLATMAFPHEVTMIPNFLLLRRFPLWTWSAGGLGGLIAAACVLRCCRGRAKLLAIPAGVSGALIAGVAVAPALARLFGLSLGPMSLLNTFPGLILPRMANGYAIFLLKGFFDSLPEELFEAGRIDGAGEMRMLWQVAFPLSKPIFAVMALQTFTAVYGSYIWALVVCQSDRMWTLMVYIFQLQQWAPPYVTMAATVLASLPTLCVFVFAQKTIMRGIIIPAYK